MLRIVSLFSVAMFLACSMAGAEDWLQFRGPTGQGHATATNLPLKWSETENVKWKTPLPGRGWSSPIMVGDQIWLTTAAEEEAPEEVKQKRLKENTGNQPLVVLGKATFFAVCLDKNTGKIIHNLKLFEEQDPQWIHAQNSYASPTPVAEAGRVYCHFGTFGTAAIDTKTGQVLWTNREHKIMHENGPGSSPILFENLLIFHCDGSDVQYITALDTSTGRTVWKTERSGAMNSNPQLKKAYGTPLVVEIDSRPVLLSPAADWLYAYDPRSGRESWKLNYETLGFSIVPRPVTSGGVLYMCTSFMQSQLLAVRYDGADGNSQPHIIWREKKSVPSMTSPLIVGKELYFVHDNGGVLSCLDAATGEVRYRERLQGKYCASPLLADGKIFFCDREGNTTIVSPGPEFKELGKNKLEGAIMASPLAVDQALYVRTEFALYRIEESK